MSASLPGPTHTEATKPKRRQWRAAALGLLALAAVIVLASLFGGGSDNKGAAGGSSASSDATSGAPTSTSDSTASQSATESGSPTVTEAPPTSEVATPTTSQSPQLGGVTVLITSQSWNAQTRSIEVVGSVQGIATETSKCTATAVGPANLNAAVDGVFDGQGTSCGLISIPVPQGASGNYQVTIDFTAPNGVAKSSPVAVQVP